MNQKKHYDVIIIGAGVVGSALLYSLSKYSDIKNIALIEKCSQAGQVNSEKNHNSQTLHFGDIETNYTVEKARSVKEGAMLVANYVESHKDQKLFNKTGKMVLAVGEKEVAELAKRHHDFKELFPRLKKIGPQELAEIEPKITENRDPNIPLLALYTESGYAIDYGKLAQSFVTESKKTNPSATTYFSTKVNKITKTKEGYAVKIQNETLTANLVMVAAGAHSLNFAQNMGYGKKYGLLSIAGSFFRTNHKLLNGKVYTLQMQKLPFAAIHGDPDVSNPNETRFGPTAKALPILEAHQKHTFWAYLKCSILKFSGIISLIKILSDKTLFSYVFKNFMYDWPFIGHRLFMKEVKKIIPSASIKDMEFSKKIGGIRPQIVNTETKKLEMGEAKIIGDNIIFNITPSPGASTCLKNARTDAIEIAKMLNKNFDLQKFNQDLLKLEVC